MQIVGNGFLARHLRQLAGAHPDVVALAAGVSTTSSRAPEQFARERAIVADMGRRCRADGLVLVFFSTASSAMYGRADRGEEDAPVEPTSPYGWHKLALEQVVAEAGCRFLVLRLSHLMGPDQPPHHLLPTLLEQARAGAFRIFRDATRDILDVADAVAALDGLLRQAVSDQVVNVASGQQTPMDLVVNRVEQRLGIRARRTYVTVDPVHAATPTVSIDRLRGFVPDLARRVSGPGYVESVIDRCVERVAEPGRPLVDATHSRSASGTLSSHVPATEAADPK
jgi:nucleoside-diphosphate-sugar epimerase